MRLDRRSFVTSAVAALAPFPSFAADHDLISASNVDGGEYCKTPQFADLFAQSAFSPQIVCGIRPERRIGGKATVRLEGDASNPQRILVHNYGHSGSGVTLSLGCASKVEKWLAANGVLQEKMIVIVGAGVIGLAMAYVLKSRGYTNITLRAREFSSGSFNTPRTVSDIAGGQFDAAGVQEVSGNILGAGEGLPDLLEASLSELTKPRRHRFDPFATNMASTAINSRPHVYTVVRNYTLRPSTPAALNDANDAFMKTPTLVEQMQALHGGRLLPTGGAAGVIAPFHDLQIGRTLGTAFRMGVRDTVLINTAKMITNLLTFADSEQFGKRIKREESRSATVNSFDDLKKIKADVIINCTGINGVRIGGEEGVAQMAGVYGLLAGLKPGVTGETNAKRYLYSGFGYMFPRTDAIIVGGAWDYGRGSELKLQAQRESGDSYISSLIKRHGDEDIRRAKVMVRAVGSLFLGRPQDIATLGDLSWFSNKDNLPCALDRAACR